MSEFFENFNSSIEPKKTAQKQNQKPKAEKKDKIQELEDDLSNMQITPKSIDILLKNLKQHHKIFKKNGIPEFLELFLKKASVEGNSKIKGQIKKFLDLYANKEEEDNEVFIDNIKNDSETSIGSKIEISIEKKLDDAITKIITKEDIKNQEEKILDLLENYDQPNEKAKIYLTLLTFYGKKKWFFEKAVCTLEKLSEILRNNEEVIFLDFDIKKIVKSNIDNYLSNLLPLLNSERNEVFCKLLDNVLFLNEEKVKQKQLIFTFLIENKNIETDDEIFKLLFLIRNHKYLDAMKYFNSKPFLINFDKKYDNLYDKNYVILQILNEFGLLAFQEKDFLFAFKLLQNVYFNKITDNENILFILCILLENKIVDERFYEVFCDNLHCIDDNLCLKRSFSVKEEIFRAFYLFSNYDYEACHDILIDIVPDLDCKKILEDLVVEKVALLTE
ncbi:hypothetical protein GVAV_000170 [Gurleya vavrai]